MAELNRAADPFEYMSRQAFEQLIEQETARIPEADWEAIRKMVVIEWEAGGAADFAIDALRKCDPKRSPVVRRKAFDLVTSAIHAERSTP